MQIATNCYKEPLLRNLDPINILHQCLHCLWPIIRCKFWLAKGKSLGPSVIEVKQRLIAFGFIIKYYNYYCALKSNLFCLLRWSKYALTCLMYLFTTINCFNLKATLCRN